MAAPRSKRPRRSRPARSRQRLSASPQRPAKRRRPAKRGKGGKRSTPDGKTEGYWRHQKGRSVFVRGYPTPQRH